MDLSDKGKLRSKLKTQKIEEEQDFLLFVGVICLAISTMSVAGPLQTVYFLKELNFSDRWMGAWAILLAFGAVVGISAGIGFEAAFFIPIFTAHFALTSIFIASYVIRFGLSFLFYIPKVSRRLGDALKV